MSAPLIASTSTTASNASISASLAAPIATYSGSPANRLVPLQGLRQIIGTLLG